MTLADPRERAATPATKKTAAVKDSRTWKERAATFAQGGGRAASVEDPRFAEAAEVVLAFLRSKPSGATWEDLNEWLERRLVGAFRAAPTGTKKKAVKTAAQSMLVQSLAFLEGQGKAYAINVRLPRQGVQLAKRTRPVRWCAGRAGRTEGEERS